MANALSQKSIVELRSMFTQLRVCDYTNLLVKLKVNPMLIDQIKKTQSVYAKLVEKRKFAQQDNKENLNINKNISL